MKDVNGKEYYVGMDVVMGKNNWKYENEKEEGKMKKDVMGFEYYEVDKNELKLDVLDELLKEKGDVWNKSVRNWEWSIGKVKDLGREKWLYRMLLSVSMMFNFWEDKEYGELKSEDVWNWGRNGCDENEFYKEDKWNLVEERVKIVKDVKKYLDVYYGMLEDVCRSEMGFWMELDRIWNLGKEDVVGKKVVLVKMILEDMGYEVVRGDEWGWGCVDYNVMVMLNYLGIKKIEGRYYEKEELDDIRRWVLGWCIGVCKERGIDGSVLDGVLFNVGRMLRGKVGSNDLVAKVIGEVNY